MSPSFPPSLTVEPFASMDREVLGELRADLERADFLKVIELYLHSLPTRVETIQMAFDNRDGVTLVRSAHSLKSTSRQIGALSLGELCSRVEQAGRAGVLEPVADWLPLLQQEARVVQTLLQQEIENK